MLLVLYDFESNEPRSNFSKFLKKFGRKIQYSVYEVRHSNRVLQNILSEVELRHSKKFSGSDSIIIVPLCEACQKKIIWYGHSSNEEKDVIIFD